MIKKLLVEFIGTFFLLLIIGTSVANGGIYTPMSVGFGLMALIYAGQNISGAHYNPAVSVAFYLRGFMPLREMTAYIIVQFMAGIMGAVFSYFVTDNAISLNMNPASGPGTFCILSSEISSTFLLVYVFLNVATRPDTRDSPFYGLAIGASVLAMAFAVGGISGGAFNPAVGVGRAVADIMMHTDNRCYYQIWYYLIGPFSGGIGAAVVYNYLNDLPIFNIQK